MNKISKIDFLLLLVYSLLPGFSKIFNSQICMIMYVPIILFF